MSLLAWPAGWRFPGGVPRHHVNPPRPRLAEPVPAAPPLTVQDFEALYGGAHAARHTCSDGHDVVIWHGDDPCFVCYPVPSDKRLAP